MLVSILDRCLNFKGRNTMIFRLTISSFWPKHSHINRLLDVICCKIIMSTRSSIVPSCIRIQWNIFNIVTSNTAIIAQVWGSTLNCNVTKAFISRLRSQFINLDIIISTTPGVGPNQWITGRLRRLWVNLITLSDLPCSNPFHSYRRWVTIGTDITITLQCQSLPG